LPKGGIEKEKKLKPLPCVCEERQSVKWLSISQTSKLSCFRRNGKYKLKITHWFEMQSDFEGHWKKESKVAWMNPEQIKEALKNLL
jgi:hypothetical protein